MGEPAQLFRSFLWPPPAFPYPAQIVTADSHRIGAPVPSAVLLELDQLGDRRRGFDEAWRALVGCELEQALRLCPVLGEKREFAAVEIGLAGLRGLHLRIGV